MYAGISIQRLQLKLDEKTNIDVLSQHLLDTWINISPPYYFGSLTYNRISLKVLIIQIQYQIPYREEDSILITILIICL